MHQYAYVGVDLGQSQDFTALCVLEEQLFFRWEADYEEFNILIPEKEDEAPCYVSPLELAPATAEKLLAAQPFMALPAGEAELAPRLYVRHLERYELGTKYTQIADSVLSLLQREPFRRRLYYTKLIIDKTGVGRPTMDIFTERGLNPVGVTIHGGDKVTMEDAMNFRVPKRDLVASVQTLLQNGNLKVAAGLPEAATLRRELQNFRVTIDPKTAHDSYSHWREGDHDDLVLSVALACWWRGYLARHQPTMVMI
jgi:hypothetical protein